MVCTLDDVRRGSERGFLGHFRPIMSDRWAPRVRQQPTERDEPCGTLDRVKSRESLVTIIVATYERAEWLAIALRSIQLSAQFASVRGISTRIIVVDDGSPSSATREVSTALGVDYVRNEDNDGRNDPSAARLMGLAAVESPYYAFFDDDDVMLPRWIAVHTDAITKGFDVAYSAYWMADADLRPQRRIVPFRVRLGDMLANHNPVNDHCLVTTDVAREVWNAGLEKAMMFGGWLELVYRGARFVRITEPTYLYRRHDRNMSDEVDPRFVELRRRLVEEYRARTMARDGRVHAPSLQLRARRRIAPFARFIARIGRARG